MANRRSFFCSKSANHRLAWIVDRADWRWELGGVTLMVWTPPDGIDVPRWWC